MKNKIFEGWGIKVSIILIIALLAGSAIFYFGAKNFYPDFSAIKNYPIDFEISSGSGLNEITDNIYYSGLIRSKFFFKIYAIAVGAASRLQAGNYEIKFPVSVAEIIKILKNGPVEIEATIIPGMTLKEIDDYFSKLKIIKSNSLIYYGGFDKLKQRYRFLEGVKNLEGFLLPDTYRFYMGSDVDFVVDKILNNFKTKTESFFSSVNNANLKKILIFASFLEKESPDYEDRKIIAGIFEKRLKIGMPLQIDATVIYAKCFGKFLNCPTLKSLDFKLDSDYNTYYYKGLTPTPISNPDLKAIKAVLEKTNSRYWYYLSDPKTKKIIFAINLDDHNKNRAKYLSP
ncbi:endolytic transglycosylase MltG [Candidatus Wolfebacteria bacterium]|nr:endolytic transglycosylase MltG [Candidatus Wolfebacteria bacterium]